MSHPIGLLAAAPFGAPALGWTAAPGVLVPVAVAAALYLAGWVTLTRRMPARFRPARAIAFLAGLAAIVLALCSPLDAVGHVRLSAHMVQHLLLMLVAPPLLWLGAPVAPLLVGLPRPARRVVASALAARPIRRLTGALADPRVGWLAFAAAFWLWHLPDAYDLAVSSDAWHHVEHACFLVAALLFWRPVILPWPARASWSRWVLIAYLAAAEAQAALLAAMLTFADRVIYSAYDVPARAGLSALDDQALAGVIMWVPGSLVFAVAALGLVFTALATPVPVSGPAMLATPERRAADRR